MKKDNVKVGQVYAAKVSGNVVPVRLDKVSSHGGWLGTNMTTRKEVRIKSSQRLRGLWPKKTMPIVTDKANDNGVAETVAAVEKGNLAEGVTVPEAKKGDAATAGMTDAEKKALSETNKALGGALAKALGKRAKRGRKAAKDATGESGRDTGQPGATGGKKERNSLLNLAAKALAEAGQPMTCKEMVEKVLATGLWKSEGKTPAATLYSAILRETQTKGEQARFRKVDKGKFVAVAQ